MYEWLWMVYLLRYLEIGVVCGFGWVCFGWVVVGWVLFVMGVFFRGEVV